jgi:hypothetical protein
MTESMSTEMDDEEFESPDLCEDCEWHQQQIEHYLLQLRKADSEDYQRVLDGAGEPLPPREPKRLLDVAVQAQLQHQRSHRT